MVLVRELGEDQRELTETSNIHQVNAANRMPCAEAGYLIWLMISPIMKAASAERLVRTGHRMTRAQDAS